MPYTASVNPAVVQEWIAGKLETSTVRQLLLEKGWNEETIAAHLAEFKKLKYGKRQLAGFICLGAGAFLGFTSCVLTMVNPVPELYNLVLYGLTSVAMVFIFVGLYYLFE